ncbi:G-protein_alpha subunit [Hexamita inflata]|uniref:G-protein alpha subunit n=1 Tax=Hexamita inflata TaxID=28002 RepID=A0AA86RBE9_9EUKA|nr:G-protein alpha subunit [Hexamita inflata]
MLKRCCVNMKKTHLEEPLLPAMLDSQVSTQKANAVIKLMLTGAGESGKSTWLKQLRLIYDSSFSESERAYYLSVITGNMLKQIQLLLKQFTQIHLDSLEENLDHAVNIILTYKHTLLTKELVDCITFLHSQDLFTNYLKTQQTLDNYTYFIQNLPRLLEQLPNNKDILCARVKTHIETQFSYTSDNVRYVFHDVAGQRDARYAWSSRLQEVDCIVFFASLIEFDQFLVEDKTKNRMEESLQIYSDLVNSPVYLRLPVILCLNKIDLLNLKLQFKSFKDFFPDFTGQNSPAEVKQYITNLYLKANRIGEKIRSVQIFETDATDTELIGTVCKTVMKFLAQEQMKSIGFM